MQTLKTARLLFNDLAAGGSSDKEYNLQILRDGETFTVAAQYGRRGGPLTRGYLNRRGGWSKAPVKMFELEADNVFHGKRNEKVSGGYTLEYEVSFGGGMLVIADNGAVELPPVTHSASAGEPPCELMTDLDERQVERFLADYNYALQKKENGERRGIRKTDSRVTGINKKGEYVELPPEIVAEVRKLPYGSCLIDGEIISRYIAFDLLEATFPSGQAAVKRADPYGARWLCLGDAAHALNTDIFALVTTWYSESQKRQGLQWLRDTRAEGGAFKRLDAPFRPGDSGQHYRYKFVKSLTAVVMLKTAKDAAKGHNSVALGLFGADGKLRQVGHASTIGKDHCLPQVGNLVEVLYLYGYGSKLAPSLVQARLERARPDQIPTRCTLDQIQFTEGQGQ